MRGPGEHRDEAWEKMVLGRAGLGEGCTFRLGPARLRPTPAQHSVWKGSCGQPQRDQEMREEEGASKAPETDDMQSEVVLDLHFVHPVICLFSKYLLGT